MVATSMVLQLPPRESSRMRVSLESRYGTWPRAPPRESVSAAITFPRALKLWFIFLLSSNRLPVQLPGFQLPAATWGTHVCAFSWLHVSKADAGRQMQM